MADNKTNRVVMVNPNPEGYGLVPHEDLSIVVDLETTKRSRNNISVKNGITNFDVDNDNTLKIKFIGGSGEKGSKHLTTNYTNIGGYKNVSTTFNNKSQDLEGLGITNIDIDFNSSYAPLIKIDFVDVRGSSILEQGNDSKYNVFFNLPYPIFKLTVKGYYGQAVTYCLHLTKWDAKFNSKTGNFEIKCEFIGHTYAFLTDMLMGYLRAAVQTKKGQNLLAQKQSENSNIISIDELIQKIYSLNTLLTKLKQDNKSVLNLAATEEKIIDLEVIIKTINSFKSSIINRTNLIYDNSKGFYCISYVNNSELVTITESIDNFESSIVPSLEEINKNLGNPYQLTLDKYKYFKNSVDSVNGIVSNSKKCNKNSGLCDSLVNKLDNQLISSETQIILIDFTEAQEELNDKLTQLKILKGVSSKQVSTELENEIRSQIGLTPTIRNIFTILATHVDIFISLIKDVANKATNEPTRKDKFKGLVNNLDINSDTSNYNSKDNLPPNIYPFPGYNVNNEESWIGKDISNIPETDFIEDLLEGFLKNTESDNILKNDLYYGNIAWYPTNIIDTLLYNNENPYDKLSNTGDYLEVFKLAIERIFTLAGFTTSNISTSDLEIMAKIEASSILEYIKSEYVLRAMVTSKNSSELLSEYNTRNKDSVTRDKFGVELLEKYIINNATPIGFDDCGTFTQNNKVDQDSVYLRIFEESEYNQYKTSYPDYDITNKLTSTDTVVDLGLLFKNSSFNNNKVYPYNSFGGLYKTQEFIDIKTSESELTHSSDWLFWSDMIYSNSFSNGDNNSSSTIIEKLNNGKINSISRKKIDFGTSYGVNVKFRTVNLFGSELYFRQSDNLFINDDIDGKITNRARAILYLHTLPFDGLTGIGSGLYDGVSTSKLNGLHPSKGDWKKVLFNQRGGFIKTPKAWLLLVGGLLWRSTEVIDPIRFYYDGNNGREYFVYGGSELSYPTNKTYLRNVSRIVSGIHFSPENYGKYLEIEEILLNLPTQVKELLINNFIQWSDSDLDDEYNWKSIRECYEMQTNMIFDNNSDYFIEISKRNNTLASISTLTDISEIKTILSDNGFKNLDICESIIIDSESSNDLNITYIDSDEDRTLQDINKDIVSTVIIGNSTWRIWGSKEENIEYDYLYTNKLTVEVDKLDYYLNTLLGEINNNLKNKSLGSKEDELKQQTFGVINNDTIKLNLYRTIKAIYDKWVAGTDLESSGIINCVTGKSDGDLISSFRFINKAFKDIGDDFLLNPLSILEQINSNSNQSFYDFISRVLVKNNFDFIPLPTYIDYRNEDDIKKMFKPVPYLEYVNNETVGPSFVCVYVGQSSKHLSLGDNEYKDDSIQFKEGDDTELPEYFSGEESDMTIPVFAVNYAKGNQGIFKDIDLNQSEFSETDESLQIIEDISLQGDKNNRTPVGQNLFNVYSTRSYQASVEAMGNAMIQPMMYFQLNNIPMFRGGYLITRVSHKIKANHMSTTFRGVRVNIINTPLINEGELYMNMLGSLSNVDIDNVTITDTNIGVLNFERIQGSNGVFILNGGNLGYVYDDTVGLAGNSLLKFMGLLQTYLQNELPNDNILLSSNGIVRDLEATVIGGSNRSKTSKHGSGLAIDLKITTNNVKTYTYPSSNNILANNENLMLKINEFVSTSEIEIDNFKIKDLIKWGGNFKNGTKRYNDLKIRVDELHHFEIKDDKMPFYFDKIGSKVNTLGLEIPDSSKTLGKFYSYVFTKDGDQLNKDIMNNNAEGDGVDYNEQSKLVFK